MKRVVFVASHLGYPMERTPLGGGAMVGLQLARAWAAERGVEVTALGSGPVPPAAGIEYFRLPEGGAGKRELVSLSELGYARFCRRFESETTSWILARGFDPKKTAVVVNDISEGPTLAALASAGFPIVSLWHVDVVDYFNRMYLKDLVAPERLTRLHESFLRGKMSGLLPDVLKLVFEKQRETVARSSVMVFPSKAMAETVRRCYALKSRSAVVPWGVWPSAADAALAEKESEGLRKKHGIGGRTTVLMTLSRVSPEKGIHLLLEALRLIESRAGALDVCLFVCGEAAFMQGAAYMRKVRAAAARLKKIRVIFPGYLDDQRKQAYYKLAHLFVSPSIHDSYGLNIVEAMQAGLPILASDHYGVQDILSDEFGRKVRYESLRAAPAALAREILTLAEDREALARMGRAASRAAESMPFSRAAKTVLELSLSLLKEDRVAAGIK